MLGHEVAHIVGKKVRNREKRKEAAIVISSKIVATYIKNAIKTWGDDIWKEYMKYVCDSENVWDEIENEISEKLKEFLNGDVLKKFFEKEYSEFGDYDRIRSSVEQLKKRSEYGAELAYLLAKGIREILNNSNELWERIKIRTENRLNVDEKLGQYEIQLKLQKKIYEITEKIVSNDSINSETFNAINTITIMMNVFSETFADLVVVLLTGMSCEDYIDSAITCQNQQNFDMNTTKNTVWLMRLGLVVGCMDLEQDWNIEELKMNHQEEHLKNVNEKVTNAVYNFVKTHFYVDHGKNSVVNKEKIMTSSMDILYDDKILDKMSCYLIECKKMIVDTFNNRENNKNLEKIRNIYKLFDTNSDIQKKLLNMQEYIDAYISMVLR